MPSSSSLDHACQEAEPIARLRAVPPVREQSAGDGQAGLAGTEVHQSSYRLWQRIDRLFNREKYEQPARYYTELAKTDPWHFFDQLQSMRSIFWEEGLRQQPWVRDVFLQWARKEPRAALFDAEKYLGYPWAEAVILEAARRQPGQALGKLRSMTGMEPPVPEGFLPKVLSAIMDGTKEKQGKHEHAEAAYYVDIWKTYPEAQAVALELAERNPWLTSRFVVQHRDIDGYGNILKKCNARLPPEDQIDIPAAA